MITAGEISDTYGAKTTTKKKKNPENKSLGWQRRLARQAVVTVNHLQAKIPVSYPTLISEIENYFQK